MSERVCTSCGQPFPDRPGKTLCGQCRGRLDRERRSVRTSGQERERRRDAIAASLKARERELIDRWRES